MQYGTNTIKNQAVISQKENPTLLQIVKFRFYPRWIIPPAMNHKSFGFPFQFLLLYATFPNK